MINQERQQAFKQFSQFHNQVVNSIQHIESELLWLYPDFLDKQIHEIDSTKVEQIISVLSEDEIDSG